MSSNLEKQNPPVQQSSSTSQIENQKKKEQVPQACQIDIKKYQNYTEEIRNKNLNTTEMLSASVNNCIHPEDSIVYNPKNIHLLPTKYPVYPLSLKPDTIKKFNDDTLFFIFFIQQDPEAREMAFRQLEERGWMFHKEYSTFFQLVGAPKNRTEELIEGKFGYFDHESEWTIRNMKEFRFDLSNHEKY